MPLDPSLAGRTFEPTAPYTVSREKIAEFTRAIGADPIDGGETAPLTFPIVIAFGAMTQLMTDPDVGIELHNVVHGDQRFEQTAADPGRRRADRHHHDRHSARCGRDGHDRHPHRDLHGCTASRLRLRSPRSCIEAGAVMAFEAGQELAAAVVRRHRGRT